METKKSGYSSRFALICVLIGGSVGTGNLWRASRVWWPTPAARPSSSL